MFEEMTEQQAREQILEMTRNYCEKYHNKKKPYQKGDRIPYASRVYDAEEMVNLVDSSLEFWLTAGRYTDEFEHAFAKYLGVRYCSLVNSGTAPYWIIGETVVGNPAATVITAIYALGSVGISR